MFKGLSILFLFWAVNVNAQILLFSDNFDDGNTSDWHLVNAELSTDHPHSGSYCVKVTHRQTAMLRKELEMATMLNYNEITIIYWWYTDPSWVTGTGVKYCRLRVPDQTMQTELWFEESLGHEPCALGGHQYGTNAQSERSFYPGTEQSYNKGQWMKIQIRYVYNSPGRSDGILQIWFNDVLKYNYSNVGYRNSTNIAYNQFYLPSNIGTSNSNCINYIDDVEIWAGVPNSDPPPSQVQGIQVTSK